MLATRTLRVRWLGRVAYQEALGLQRALFANRQHDYLLLLEHPHVVTMSRRTPPQHVLADIESLGAELFETDRGGDVTYHGPGQLVAYPILEVPGQRGGGLVDTAAYVSTLEQLLIDALADIGVESGRIKGYPGVWVDPNGDKAQKIAAVGVRIARGRSMHGLALNVNPDLQWYERIVPCGISGKGVTSLAALGVNVSMSEVVEVLSQRAVTAFASHGSVDIAGVGFRNSQSRQAASQQPLEHFHQQADGTSVRLLGRLAQADATNHDPLPLRARKPDWLRVKFNPGPNYRRLKSTMHELDLVTVCEEAKCPNISECWNDGTATFMILGDRCTRACGFCAVSSQHPAPPEVTEAARVAQAVELMALRHAVITMVARDDLEDGGASAVVDVVGAIRKRTPLCRVEVLVSDFKGSSSALKQVFGAQPDVFNHNIETVARLQRAVRPSAGYARSLAVLAQAKTAGLITKSSIIAGMGESDAEIRQTLIDLAAIAVDIVTIGQYLRPTSLHLPVAQWWPPEAFEQWKLFGESAGLGHVEASPLTRSSYHARQSTDRLAQGRD